MKQIEKNRVKAFEIICNISEMRPGSFAHRYRKCGKPNCRCATGTGHPYYRITLLQNGVAKTQVIPDNQAPRVQALCENYKVFRTARKNLRVYQRELNTLLDRLQDLLVQETREKIKNNQ